MGHIYAWLLGPVWIFSMMDLFLPPKLPQIPVLKSHRHWVVKPGFWLPLSYSLRPLPHWQVVSEFTGMPWALEAFVLHTFHESRPFPETWQPGTASSHPHPPIPEAYLRCQRRMKLCSWTFQLQQLEGKSATESADIRKGRLTHRLSSPYQPGCQSCEHRQTRPPWEMSGATCIWGIYSDMPGNGMELRRSKPQSSHPCLAFGRWVTEPSVQVKFSLLHQGRRELMDCELMAWKDLWEWGHPFPY